MTSLLTELLDPNQQAGERAQERANARSRAAENIKEEACEAEENAQKAVREALEQIPRRARKSAKRGGHRAIVYNRYNGCDGWICFVQRKGVSLDWLESTFPGSVALAVYTHCLENNLNPRADFVTVNHPYSTITTHVVRITISW